VFDERVANDIARLLSDELIPAEVVTAPPMGFEVWVREDHVDRARTILAADSFSDAELNYLATGDLGEQQSER
jgi:hypothetical protein